MKISIPDSSLVVPIGPGGSDKSTFARRRRIRRDLELPVRDAYLTFLRSLMRSSGGV
jgi:hypothetical protein